MNGYDMENVSAGGFWAFCKSNASLVISVLIVMFFTYGIKLFQYSFGIDTELYMAYPTSVLAQCLSVGRFGYFLLGQLRFIFFEGGLNPFTVFFITFCLIWFFTLSWCYIIAIFDKNTGRNNKLIPFALVFMTMPIWAENFYFIPHSAETALIIAISPYAIYILINGILNNNWSKIVCASILFTFMVSVYPAIVPLFCCGICACLLLLHEHSNYEPRVYRRLYLKIITSIAASVILYLFVDRIAIPTVFEIERAAYLDNMNKWGAAPFIENILQILLFGYIITVGHLQQAQDIVIPVVMNYTQPSTSKIEMLIAASRSAGNILLIPTVVVFFVKLYTNMRKKIMPKCRMLYMLAGIGIPLCIMMLAIAGGNIPPIRTLYALPFASAFMFFFIIRASRGKIAMVITVIAFSLTLYQAQVSAQLFYSDKIRFDEDVRMAHKFNEEIVQVQTDYRKLPVAFIGRYQPALKYGKETFKGQVIGFSFFEFPHSTATRALTFMKILGMPFDAPNERQFNIAVEAAKTMPAYPDAGYIKRVQDVIVVKLSDPVDD